MLPDGINRREACLFDRRGQLAAKWSGADRLNLAPLLEYQTGHIHIDIGTLAYLIQ
jgi:hypothetical protein